MSDRTSTVASRKPRHRRLRPPRRSPPEARGRPAADDGGSVVARSGPRRRLVVYAALLVFALVYIYPFVVQVSTAFKTNADAVANPLAIVPDPITTAAFAAHRRRPTSRCGS